MKGRRDPFANFWQIQRQIDQLIDSFFEEELPGGFGSEVTPESSVWRPPVDVYETADTFIILVELPGVLPEEDVRIELTDHVLTIRGTRRDRSPRKKQHYHIAEINYGPFERIVRLPRVIDQEATPEAHYENGFLEIVIPKEVSSRSRIIPIQVKPREREIVVEPEAPSTGPSLPKGEDQEER
ncbi:MAG: hypothetical protein KatS3mg115_1427 [Candidatus Poribacteria bacterium]|nr:MAG: hypothetical protein KatS3mg115_1427 [Candidatus Poribacteria bacterium]